MTLPCGREALRKFAALTFAILLVVSTPAMFAQLGTHPGFQDLSPVGTATAQSAGDSFGVEDGNITDDFEDGDVDEWTVIHAKEGEMPPHVAEPHGVDGSVGVHFNTSIANNDPWPDTDTRLESPTFTLDNQSNINISWKILTTGCTASGNQNSRGCHYSVYLRSNSTSDYVYGGMSHGRSSDDHLRLGGTLTDFQENDQGIPRGEYTNKTVSIDRDSGTVSLLMDDSVIFNTGINGQLRGEEFYVEIRTHYDGGDDDAATTNWDDISVTGTNVSMAGGGGSQDISGQVVSCPASNPECSDPGAVPDGTVVEAYGVKEPNVNAATGQSLKDRAQEIRDDMRSFDPEDVGWNPDLSLVGSGGEFTETGNEYVAVHRRESWGLEGWSSGTDVDQPLLTAPADEPVILTVWDPASEAIVEDGTNAQLPGEVSEGTIILEQLDYTGDVVNVREVETDQTRSSISPLAADKKYAEVNLPTGFYRVSVEGSPFSYVMTVGSPQQLTKTITNDLETEYNRASGQAERVQELITDEKVVRLTTTTYTGENGTAGKFNFTSVPNGVNVLAVQAYSPSGEALQDPQNATFEDLREVAAREDYSGSFYVTPLAEDVDVPSSDVEIKTLEVSAVPFMDPSRFQSKSDYLRDLFQNSSFADVAKETLDTTTEDLEQMRENLRDLRDENQQFEDRYDELLEDFKNESGDPTDTEEYRLLQQAVRDLEGQLEQVSEDTETEFSDGTISATIPWSGDLDPDNVAVVANFPQSGTSEPVPDEYVSVNKRVGQPDVVEVTDFPVPEDTPMVTFGVTVNGEDGEQLGNAKVPAVNPGFSGKLIDLDSVSVSTLRPGPSESITVRPNPGEDSVRLESVTATVDGPSGDVNATPTDDGKAVEFTTDGAGGYFITLEMTDTSGNSWSEGLSVKADGNNTNQPPSVRARDGFTGTFAVVGDGLRDGSISTEGGVLRASAVADNGNVPGEVHFYTSQVGNNHLATEVRVLKASSGGTPESVRKHVKVFLHTGTISEDAVIYRQGNQAIPERGENRFGAVTCPTDSDGCTLASYTEANGAATFTINNNPSVVESTFHYVRMRVPFDIPGPLTITPPSGLLDGLDGVQIDAPAWATAGVGGGVTP